MEFPLINIFQILHSLLKQGCVLYTRGLFFLKYFTPTKMSWSQSYNYLRNWSGSSLKNRATVGANCYFLSLILLKSFLSTFLAKVKRRYYFGLSKEESLLSNVFSHAWSHEMLWHKTAFFSRFKHFQLSMNVKQIQKWRWGCRKKTCSIFATYKRNMEQM